MFASLRNQFSNYRTSSLCFDIEKKHHYRSFRSLRFDIHAIKSWLYLFITWKFWIWSEIEYAAGHTFSDISVQTFRITFFLLSQLFLKLFYWINMFIFTQQWEDDMRTYIETQLDFYQRPQRPVRPPLGQPLLPPLGWGTVTPLPWHHFGKSRLN